MRPHRLDDQVIRQFLDGTLDRAYEGLGAHPAEHDGQAGAWFSVWAPNARSVSVIGRFNLWDPAAHPLRRRGESGVWDGFVAGAHRGDLYKFEIAPADGGPPLRKADPFAFSSEPPPGNASRLVDITGYRWHDGPWMERRARTDHLSAPLSIYEVHLGSWLPPRSDGLGPGYRELAPRLADYVAELGFTHVELMPVAEHPFTGSWGYQVTGYYAPTYRHGSPKDLMFLIDHLHQRGIGVILDWVPGHFPRDPHGLSRFDGSYLFEYADPRKREHGEWSTDVFDYEKGGVVSFLISNAVYWLREYHVDGLRVDAVSSMLYLDYARRKGQWAPNRYGGNENMEAIAFLRKLNETIHRACPGALVIAEESTSWPGVTRPTDFGGLGFDLKWDLGWMHDILNNYLRKDYHERHDHADQLSLRSRYMTDEHYLLPLSHDEVVHGKGSLVEKMPGPDRQKFANVRLLFGHQFAQPGKTLIFMGDEFGQRREWNHDTGLDWRLLEVPSHRGLQRWVHDLNALVRDCPALHQLDADPAGFEWVDHQDAENGVISFLRRGRRPDQVILFVFNFRPDARIPYRVGVPSAGIWTERLNSDSTFYGGGNFGNFGGVNAEPMPWQDHPFSINLVLPPLGMLALTPESEPR